MTTKQQEPISDYKMETWDMAEVFTGWINELKRYNLSAPGISKKILLISCYPWVTSSMLAYAVGFRRLGYLVDILWFPYICGLIDNPGENQNKYLFEMEKVTQIAKPFGIELYKAGDVAEKDLSVSITKQIWDQSFFDIMYLNRADYFNHQTSFQFLQGRFERNLLIAKQMSSFLENNVYSSIINPNGNILEWSAITTVLDSLKRNYFTIETAPGKYVFAAANCPVTQLKTGPIWDLDYPHDYTADRKTYVEEMIKKRSSLDYWNDDYCAFQFSAPEETIQLKNRLGIPDKKRIALLCPGVPYETTSLKKQSPFEFQFDWIANTIEHFANLKDSWLVVRIHPGEVFHDSQIPALPYIQSRVKDLPENITIIPADMDLNTYGLFQMTDLGIGFSSTTGLEMAVLGIPVITVADSHYSQKGFTLEPSTIHEYREMLSNFNSVNSYPKLSQGQIEKARCYYEMYFNHFRLPVPWIFQNTWLSMPEFSMEEFLTEDGLQEFLPTFNRLAESFHQYAGVVGVDPVTPSFS